MSTRTPTLVTALIFVIASQAPVRRDRRSRARPAPRKSAWPARTASSLSGAGATRLRPASRRCRRRSLAEHRSQPEPRRPHADPPACGRSAADCPPGLSLSRVSAGNRGVYSSSRASCAICLSPSDLAIPRRQAEPSAAPLAMRSPGRANCLPLKHIPFCVVSFASAHKSEIWWRRPADAGVVISAGFVATARSDNG
jgi:hypothetical protein